MNPAPMVQEPLPSLQDLRFFLFSDDPSILESSPTTTARFDPNDPPFLNPPPVNLPPLPIVEVVTVATEHHVPDAERGGSTQDTTAPGTTETTGGGGGKGGTMDCKTKTGQKGNRLLQPPLNQGQKIELEKAIQIATDDKLAMDRNEILKDHVRRAKISKRTHLMNRQLQLESFRPRLEAILGENYRTPLKQQLQFLNMNMDSKPDFFLQSP